MPPEATTTSSADSAGATATMNASETKEKKGPETVSAAAKTGDAADPVLNFRAALADEQKRANDVNKIAKDHPELAEKAIRENWSTEKTELTVLREGREKDIGAPNVIMREAGVNAKVLEAAVCLHVGIGEKVLKRDKEITDKTLELADKDFKNIGLKELVQLAARLDGKRIPFVFGDGMETIRLGFTSVSLPNILENVAQKALLAAYESVPSAAKRICRKGNARDFKQVSRLRFDGTGAWGKVGDGGNLEHGKVSDKKMTNQLDTYGQVIMLTRQMVLNDDVGAFADIARMQGLQGAALIDDLFFTALLANANSFFHANNNNLKTSNAFAFAGLSAAVAAFRKMKSGPGSAAKDKKPINISPKFLVVPVELEIDAQILIGSAQLMSDGNSAAVRNGLDNPFRNKYEIVAPPHISDSAYTGYSASTWFLFADPNLVPAYELLYLNGQENPILERVEPGPETLGMGWRGYTDVGVGQMDTNGALKSTA